MAAADCQPRQIVHADMDAFYAAVEQCDDPSLQGKPVVVGGEVRGVVAAASYEARVFGIHSAMPMVHAKRCCPNLVIVTPRMARYAEVSAEVFSIFRSLSPLVESLSLDEAFIDLTGTERLLGPAQEVARALKRRVLDQTGLVVSVGLAPNKFAAKIASDLEKPDGLVIVQASELRTFLDPLPVTRLFGVGRVAAGQIHRLGLRTIGDLRACSAGLLEQQLGHALGAHLVRLANGIDDRPVVADRVPKSVGHENTFAEDISDVAELSRILKRQADRVARRLRKHQLVGGSVVLKVKFADFSLKTRRKTLPRPSADGVVIGRCAQDLLRKLAIKGLKPVRLTGVSAASLEHVRTTRQLSFDEAVHEKGDRLERALDQIADKFGDAVVKRGG